MAVKSLDGMEGMVAVGNTDSARTKLKKSGLKILEYGTIPGIPGTHARRSQRDTAVRGPAGAHAGAGRLRALARCH